MKKTNILFNVILCVFMFNE